MIRIIESSTYYVTRDDAHVLDKVNAANKEAASNRRHVQNLINNYKDMFDEDIYVYDWDEYFDRFGKYPENFYAVKDGVAIKKFNTKDKASAEREARRSLGSDEYDEVVSYDEFYEDHDYDPESDFEDIEDYDDSDYEEIYGDPYDEYGNRIDGRRDDRDYSPSSPWNAPGMSPDDFI